METHLVPRISRKSGHCDFPTPAKRRKRGSPMAQSQGDAKVDEALLSLLPGTKTFVLAHPASAAVD
jgi:hypothetical protein